MSTFQKIIICGNLGQDPNTKIFDGGGQVTNIAVATTENWKDKQTGEKRSLTEWHNVVIHGKLSEIADKYLNKGDKVLIEGTLKTRKWTGTDNIDHYTTEIICRGLTMMSTKKTESTPESLTQNQTSNKDQKPTENFPDPNPGDNDDLPF